MTRPPTVAIFDAELPTGLAFIRSLGRAGVPFIAYSSDGRAMGRRSRYTTDFRRCPSVQATDDFVPWLLSELSANSIHLVAPTSDYVAFNVAEANLRSTPPADLGHPPHSRLLDCLFKDRFAAAMSTVGFPTPAMAAPTTMESALEFAESVGYPVVMKPRSHVAVGVNRGMVLTSPHDVSAAFRPYPIGGSQSVALSRDANLAWPILQQFMDLAHVDVLSVTGCLDENGEPLALAHSKKTHQWPPKIGIGTRFVPVDPQIFTDRAVAAVAQVLGSGLFELEVLLDRRSGEYWAIDLNPRAFGQISLDIALGNDLPVLWYRSVTRTPISAASVPGCAPASWLMGTPFAADVAVGMWRRSSRRRSTSDLLSTIRSRSVGAAFDRSDPLPAVPFVASFLRHPGGLVRPFLRR